MPGAFSWIAVHRKSLAAVVGALITFAVQMGWQGNPYAALVIGIATAAGVYQLPNKAPAPAAVPAGTAAPQIPGTAPGGTAAGTGHLPPRITLPPPGTGS